MARPGAAGHRSRCRPLDRSRLRQGALSASRPFWRDRPRTVDRADAPRCALAQQHVRSRVLAASACAAAARPHRPQAHAAVAARRIGLRRAQSQIQAQVVLSRGRAQARPLARRHLACDQRGGGRRHRAWTGGETPDRHSPQHPPCRRDAHLRTERERRAAGRVRRPHRAGKAVGFRAGLAWKSGIARRFRHLRSGRR